MRKKWKNSTLHNKITLDLSLSRLMFHVYFYSFMPMHAIFQADHY